MEINIVETDQQLQQILWTCYDYWCKEDLPPNKRSICYSWISRSYTDRFGGKFHQSKLSQLTSCPVMPVDVPQDFNYIQQQEPK